MKSAMRNSNQPRQLIDTGVPLRVKLAALWVAVALMYAYVDILSFYKPGVVADILRGRVWQFEITQGWALGSLVLVSVPIVMVGLSPLVPARAARVLNIVIGVLYLPVSVGNVVGENWLYLYFGAAVEVALLLTIVRLAWSWPRAAVPAP